MIILASPFSDSAVFQRRKMIPVWGYADANVQIQADFAGHSAFIRSNSNGKFLLYLPPMEAGGPYELTVRNMDRNEQVTIRDVMVGEVWLASGQSNMEYPLRGGWATSDNQYKILPQHEEFLEELKKISADDLRFLHVPQNASGVREESFNAVWKKTTDLEATNKFSAIALWFALKLVQYEKVPVGIIGSYWGGTCINAWTSREMMLKDPVESKIIQKLDTVFYQKQNWNGCNDEALEDLCRQYCHEDPGYSREILAQTVETLDDNWQPYVVPGYWTLRRIAGNGAIWICKKVQIPASWQNKNVELHIGGVDKHDISFINGHEVGRTGSGFDCTVYEKKRCYQIPADLIKAGEENSVAIRAYSFIYGGGFNGNAENYYLSCGDERVELGSQWYYRVEVDFGEVVIDRSHFYGRGNPNTPGILFDGQIAPLIPYAIRGAIWYQGESDSDFNAAPHYADQMQNMINDWRFRFGCGDFAFYQVQLAGYTGIAPIMDRCGWAYLRESQQIACDKMNGVGLISAIDIGEEEDIHPHDKKTVAVRLANKALQDIYGKTIYNSDHPRAKKVEFYGNTVKIYLSETEKIQIKGDTVKGFYLADKKRNFQPAEAVCEGSVITLHCDQIDLPEAVRYAWSTYPDANVFNEAGLPLLPFRTDSWNW